MNPFFFKKPLLKKKTTCILTKLLYKNTKALNEFEKFLKEAYNSMQLGNKLKNGYIVN